MVSPTFTSYHVFNMHELFADQATPEQQALKVKATKITNIVFVQTKNRDLEVARHFAHHHFQRLANIHNQVDHVRDMLAELQEKGINDFGLSEIAHCYGYNFRRVGAAHSGQFELTPLQRL